MDDIMPEIAALVPYACHKSALGRYITEAAPDKKELFPRTDFQRDRDRIIHSSAFLRLRNKTQVFVYHEGDSFRTRLTHSLEVAQIARTIARALSLNEDVAEAVALAHDLGHPPFGHAGEEAMNKVMAPFGGFDHNEQSVRVLTLLEEKYASFDGLNLTGETLEGVVKHNGPLITNNHGKAALRPTIEALNSKWNLKLDLYAPAEAQVANMSDDIAYLAHDFNDGLRAGLLQLDQLEGLPVVGDILVNLHKLYPNCEQNRLVHELSRRLISYFVQDILNETVLALAALNPQSVDDIRSAGKPVICHSAAAADALSQLRTFLFKYSWRHFKVNRMTSKSKHLLTELFERLLDEPNLLPTEWQAALENKDGEQKARIIADYVASMTDRYALLEYERIFEPGPILL